MPLVASNRYGLERSLQDPEHLYLRFYGSSFIADPYGRVLVRAPRDEAAVRVVSANESRNSDNQCIL